MESYNGQMHEEHTGNGMFASVVGKILDKISDCWHIVKNLEHRAEWMYIVPFIEFLL